jgi:aryl-alcohol dehydrogenase-like predicted oxidoreductase
MSIRDSLKQLQTDWIDLLYVHWWDQTTSIEEVMDSLQVLVEQGKVPYLGISDTPAWVASAANSYARAHGKTPFSIYQGRWNVILRDFERDITPMARHFGMALAPWDAMGGGKFKTKEEIEERKAQGQPLRSLLSGDQTEEESVMSEALGKVASEHGGKPITAIALAYVIAKAPNVFPLIGGRKIKHLEENIQALNIRLTTEQMEYLESQKQFDVGFPGNFIGPDPKATGKPSPLLASNAPYAFVRSAASITSPE